MVTDNKLAPRVLPVPCFFPLECRVRVSRLAVNLRNLRNLWLLLLFKPGEIDGELWFALGVFSRLVSGSGRSADSPTIPAQ